MTGLDLLDKKILYELDINARISASQLARKLKKSKETVNFRLNKLIKEGIIKGFYPITNTSKFGLYYYKVYLKFNNLTPEREKEIVEYVNRQKHIAFLATAEGFYDCIFVVMVRNADDMLKFMDPFMGKYGDFIQEKAILTLLSSHRFNLRFLFEGEIKKDAYYPISLGDYKLDKTDKAILSILKNNARTSLSDIAKQIGINPKIVAYRLRKLEKDNIILTYVTSIDFDKLGYRFVQVNLSLKDSSYRRKIIEYFTSTKKCLVAIELLGKYDLTIEVYVKSTEEIKDILNQFRKKFVEQYSYYDVSTITKEFRMVWGPLSREAEI